MHCLISLKIQLIQGSQVEILDIQGKVVKVQQDKKTSSLLTKSQQSNSKTKNYTRKQKGGKAHIYLMCILNLN